MVPAASRKAARAVVMARILEATRASTTSLALTATKRSAACVSATRMLKHSGAQPLLRNGGSCCVSPWHLCCRVRLGGTGHHHKQTGAQTALCSLHPRGSVLLHHQESWSKMHSRVCTMMMCVMTPDQAIIYMLPVLVLG